VGGEGGVDGFLGPSVGLGDAVDQTAADDDGLPVHERRVDLRGGDFEEFAEFGGGGAASGGDGDAPNPGDAAVCFFRSLFDSDDHFAEDFSGVFAVFADDFFADGAGKGVVEDADSGRAVVFGSGFGGIFGEEVDAEPAGAFRGVSGDFEGGGFAGSEKR